MFDVGWTEMLVLGIVTLLVVGPRELPGLLKTIGRYVAQMRKFAGDFRDQMDDMSDELQARADFEKFADHKFLKDIGTPDLFSEEDEKALTAAADASDETLAAVEPAAPKAEGKNDV